MAIAEAAINFVRQEEPSLKLLTREIGREGRVCQALLRVGNRHGRERGIEKPGAGMLVAIAHEHVAGQVAALLPFHAERP